MLARGRTIIPHVFLLEPFITKVSLHYYYSASIDITDTTSAKLDCFFYLRCWGVIRDMCSKKRSFFHLSFMYARMSVTMTTKGLRKLAKHTCQNHSQK